MERNNNQNTNQAAQISREQAESRILFNLTLLSDREIRLVDAFIQGLKKSQG